MAEQYYKIVNGERVEITGDELTATKAEWQANNDAFPAQQLEQLRAERNGKLAECDWVVVKAQEKGTEVPAAWTTYRQALRDITNSATSVDDVTWPDKPE